MQWFGLSGEPAGLKIGPKVMLEEEEDKEDAPPELLEPEVAVEFPPIFGKEYGLDPDTFQP